MSDHRAPVEQPNATTSAPADRPQSSIQTQRIQELAVELEPYIIGQRRYFHQHPELSLQEVETTAAIARELDAMGIPYERPLATGVVATIRGGAPGAYLPDGTPRRRLLLRADIDALPVTEQTGAPYASVNAGVMHACGHDCHVAMMLGACRMLARMAPELAGEVRVVFQPSEENGQGARMMIDAGVLDGVDGGLRPPYLERGRCGPGLMRAGPAHGERGLVPHRRHRYLVPRRHAATRGRRCCCRSRNCKRYPNYCEPRP